VLGVSKEKGLQPEKSGYRPIPRYESLREARSLQRGLVAHTISCHAH
jgi:hypothetical protein